MTLLNMILMALPSGQSGSNPLMSFLPIVLIIVVFYFFMIRPQTKKAKSEREFKEGLKKGDKVVTIGGIHGRIVETQERTYTIETEGSEIRLKVEKSAISMDLTKSVAAPKVN